MSVSERAERGKAMARHWDRPAGLLLPFAVVSVAAVVTGAFVAASNGVPAALWGRNIAAWAVGAGAAAAIVATVRPIYLSVSLWAAPVGLAASFLSGDLQGVHRWINIGPVHLNAAMLLLPGAIVALGALARERPWAWAPALASLGLLAAQPDASQASTAAVSAAVIAVAAIRRPILRGAMVAVAGLAAVCAWLQPDTLRPVPEVEGIIGLASSLSTALAGVAWLLLAATAAAPIIWARRESAWRLAGWALGLCFLLWAVTPTFGAFPVPFIGIGLSPILGAWLGVGALAGLSRRSAAAQVPMS